MSINVKALAFIVEEILKANEYWKSNIGSHHTNEVLLGIFDLAMDKFDITLEDDEDALSELFTHWGRDQIREAEAGLIPIATDRPKCRACQSIDVSLLDSKTDSSNWNHSDLHGWHWQWDHVRPTGKLRMECNECGYSEAVFDRHGNSKSFEEES